MLIYCDQYKDCLQSVKDSIYSQGTDRYVDRTNSCKYRFGCIDLSHHKPDSMSRQCWRIRGSIKLRIFDSPSGRKILNWRDANIAIRRYFVELIDWDPYKYQFYRAMHTESRLVSWRTENDNDSDRLNHENPWHVQMKPFVNSGWNLRFKEQASAYRLVSDVGSIMNLQDKLDSYKNRYLTSSEPDRTLDNLISVNDYGYGQYNAVNNTMPAWRITT